MHVSSAGPLPIDSAVNITASTIANAAVVRFAWLPRLSNTTTTVPIATAATG